MRAVKVAMNFQMILKRWTGLSKVAYHMMEYLARYVRVAALFTVCLRGRQLTTYAAVLGATIVLHRGV